MNHNLLKQKKKKKKKAQAHWRRAWHSLQRRLAPYSSPTAPSAVESKQEILSVLSQGGFALVPHYPSLMRSPKPLPDPQSLLETADHFFSSGTVPPTSSHWTRKSSGIVTQKPFSPSHTKGRQHFLFGPEDSTPAFRPTDTEAPQATLQNSAGTPTRPWVSLANPTCLQ